MADERWLTVQQIAQILTVDVETVRRWLRSGELSGALLGRKAGYRVRERDFEQFMECRVEAHRAKMDTPREPDQQL